MGLEEATWKIVGDQKSEQGGATRWPHSFRLVLDVFV